MLKHLFILLPLSWLGASVGAGQGTSLELSTLASLCGGALSHGAWLSNLQGSLVPASSSGGIVSGLLCSEASLLACPLTSVFYLRCCCRRLQEQLCCRFALESVAVCVPFVLVWFSLERLHGSWWTVRRVWPLLLMTWLLWWFLKL